jgi:hypothetical protein
MKNSNNKEWAIIKDEETIYIRMGLVRFSIYLIFEGWASWKSKGSWFFEIGNRRISRYFIQIGIPQMAISLYMPKWVEYWVRSIDQMQAEDHQYQIVNDPMNGCPEDFMEGYYGSNQREYSRIERAKEEGWVLGVRMAEYFIGRHFNKLQENRIESPWE